MRIERSEFLSARARWAARGITPTMAFKLEVLYFGDPALLNVWGHYARTDWPTIRLALGFRTTDQMLAIVKQSGDFLMIGKNAGFTSRWLTSHSNENQGQNIDLFAAEDELETAEDKNCKCNKNEQKYCKCNASTAPSGQENCPKMECSSREARAAEYIPAKSNIRGCQGEEEGFDADELNEGVNEKGASFFHWLNGRLNPYGQPLFMKINGRIHSLDPSLSDASIREVLIALIEKHLIPYMDENSEMLRRNRRGRIAWLENLVMTKFGKKLCCDAMQTVRDEHRTACETSRRELAQQRRACRPLSPYEYMDEASGTRLYDDPRHPVTPDDDPVRLPAYAPPRPSATAFWHPLRRQWISDSR